jgi:hypothetical protein
LIATHLGTKLGAMTQNVSFEEGNMAKSEKSEKSAVKETQMQIEINTEVLKTVLSMKDDEARQKIDQTKRVRINGDTLIDVEPKNQTITVEAPTGDGLVIIDLINKDGATTTLAYDLKAKKFRQ